ncbi:MAG: SurA N-terminal domain-containing protein [Deltaproteobacteria bacterium]|jgi:peptidyl-prolyl cis-trans isomerase D|nr:SurA N-terminal domain-containing protein [Deltaproteobacteria bacterium]
MLGVLRRNKNNPVLVILLGLAVALMVGFGVSVQSVATLPPAATVDGEEITDAEFSARYASTYRMRQYQDKTYDRARAERDKLRENVLNGMVTTKILAKEARRLGLEVDNQSLKDAILENPNFQTEGRFDKDQYERMLAQMQTTDLKFETSERERLLAEKYLALIQGMTVSDAEVKEQFEKDQTKVNVEFVLVEKKDFAVDVGTVNAADAAEFMKKPDAEEQIQKYYTKNKSTKFDVPEQVCAQHVLVRAERQAPPDLRAEAKKKIEVAARAITGGMDFAQAAKKFSDDANKDKAGDLGCFSLGQMLPQIEEVAFGLEVGKVSTIIETPFGFHLVKVTEKKAPIQRKLEDAKEDIAMELVRQSRSGERAKQKAAEILAAAQAQPNLQLVVDALNKSGGTYKVDETGPFPAGRDFLPRLGLAKEVAATAWTLTNEKPLADAPIETEAGFVVLRLKERLQPKDADFEGAKISILYALTNKKQESVFEGWSKSLRDQHKVDINPLAVSYDDTERSQARRQAPQ